MDWLKSAFIGITIGYIVGYGQRHDWPWSSILMVAYVVAALEVVILGRRWKA